MLQRGIVSEDAVANVTFTPYGIGPTGGVVLRVDEAEASDASVSSKKFASMLRRQNVIARVTPEVAVASLRGGGYTGEIRVTPEGEGLYLVLTKAERKQ